MKDVSIVLDLSSSDVLERDHVQSMRYVTLDIYIDGKFFKIMEVTIGTEEEERTIELKANQTIKIMKLSEAYMGVAIIRNLLSLPIEPVPKEEKVKVEFIGDSLTSGYGNMGTENEFQSDASQTWFVELSNHFNCEFVNHSWGGIGLFEDWNGNRDNQIPEIRRRWLATDPSTSFDFSLYPVDYVFINIGTNDLWRREEKIDPEFKSQFINAYISMIEECFNQYGNELKVFIIQGPLMLPNGRKIVEEVINHYKNDKRHVYQLNCDLSTDDKSYWGFWDHPNVKGNHLIAQQLIEQLKELI